MASPVRFRGKWRIRWLDHEGTRQSDVFATHREAEYQLSQRETEAEEVRRGLRRPAPDDHTCNELFDYWLRLNYRTTAAICRYAMGALGDEAVDDLDDGVATRRGYVSLRAGQAPTVRGFDDGAGEVAFVVAEVERLTATGLAPESICITARRQKTLKDRFLEALTDAGITADLLEREEPRRPSVRLATMHRIKGLEFSVVFVVSVDEDELPYRSDERDTSDPMQARLEEVAERCLLYVATSRARDALYVTHVGAPSPFLSGMRVPPTSAAAE